MSRSKAFSLRKFSKEIGVPFLKEQTDIFRKAIDVINSRYPNLALKMKTDFDGLLQEIEKEAYKIYLKEEESYVKKVITAFVKKKIKKGQSELRFLLDNERVFAGIYLSLIQGRKNRAGKTLERILSLLFEKAGYPFTYQPPNIDGRPDYIMPSVEYYHRSPLNSIVFTSKRKLRERWRQIVTEGMRGIGFYLGTIDEDLSPPELTAMTAHHIFVVCPREIKRKRYPNASNVLSYEQFFQEHLEPKLRIWRREKII